MNPELGFILAAGFGTRMGTIGQILPKPLWSFFELKLIDIQSLILKKMGIKKIVVNAHHGYELLKDYFREDKNVILLHEQKILGTGGAIANAAAELKWNNIEILIANSDFFIIEPINEIKNKVMIPLEADGEMIIFKDKTLRYSNLILDSEKCLISLEKDSKETERFCYSGYSRIKVSTLNYRIEKSSIFENFLNYHEKKIRCLRIKGLTYLDLGEKELFVSTIYQLHDDFIHKKNSLCLNWLLENKVIDPSKFSHHGYADEGLGVFNFTGKKLLNKYPKGSIILKEGSPTESKTAVLCFENIHDIIDL